MAADNSSPSLNQRGLKWFFRTSPHDIMFTQAMFDFFRDIGAKTGRKVQSVVLFHEDTIFGTDSSNAQKQMAEAAGIKVAADIRYRGNSPSLSAEVQQIKAADADVIMPSSYTSDAILLMRGMHDVGYTPKAIMAQSAGFAEQAFIDAVGPLAGGRDEPFGVRARCGEGAAGDPGGERAVSGTQQQGPERQHRARDHRADGAGRCDQPRRIDR